MDNDRNWIVVGMTVVGAIILAMVVAGLAGVWDDDPTSADAEEAFCDDVSAYIASLGALRDVDGDTPIEEFEEQRENVRTAYENMIESALAVREVRLIELEEANEDLRAAVDDISDDQSLNDALDSIEEEVDAVSEELSQALNDVNCGSGQGGQERSDE